MVVIMLIVGRNNLLFEGVNRLQRFTIFLVYLLLDQILEEGLAISICHHLSGLVWKSYHFTVVGLSGEVLEGTSVHEGLAVFFDILVFLDFGVDQILSLEVYSRVRSVNMLKIMKNILRCLSKFLESITSLRVEYFFLG